MAEQCVECGCVCSEYSAPSSECISLREEIAKLCEKLNDSERRRQELEIILSDSSCAKEDENLKVQEKNDSYLEQNKRLKESYDDALQQNQKLESQILKMADELQAEKKRFDEALVAMTERLVNATEDMNRMEKETLKSRKDCSLVIQLLKCNQSVDRNFVARKVDSFPSDLKHELQEQLELKETSDVSVKPRITTTVADTNGNATGKSSSSKRSFLQRRSKSVTSCNTGNGFLQNGFPSLK